MEIPRSRKFFAFKKPSTYTMPHRCVAGGCSNTAKDGVSLHGWPTNAQLARQWTNAVRNTRANFNQTASSKLCSSHFSDDSFETQSVIAHSLGLKMKKLLKPDAVPTIFHNCPPQKRQRREHSTDRTEGYSSPAYGSRAQQFPKQPRRAYRKREAARVRIADYLKLALFCKCNPQRTNVNLITLFFFGRSSLNTKHSILRYPMKAVSRGMKERVELNRYLRHRRQPHKHSLTVKMFLCNFVLKVLQKASF